MISVVFSCKISLKIPNSLITNLHFGLGAVQGYVNCIYKVNNQHHACEKINHLGYILIYSAII